MPRPPGGPGAGLNRGDSPSVAQFLLPDGLHALRKYLQSTRDIAREISARFVNHSTQSGAMRKWLRIARVSEILEPSLPLFIQKVESSVRIPDEEREQFVSDASEIYRKATELARLLVPGGGPPEFLS